MKKLNLKFNARWLMAVIAMLTIGTGAARADYVQVAQFQSSAVIGNASSYSSYDDDDWYLSRGGGGTNNTCGWNKTNGTQHVTLDETFGVDGVTTSTYGFYIYSKSALANVEKITITSTNTSNSMSSTDALYLLYSTNNGSSWSQISLSSGSQGASAGTSALDKTFTFTPIASARYAILFSGGSTTASTFRFDNVEITFYKQNTVTLTYHANGATSGSVPVDASSPYAPSSTVTVKANTGNLARTGCTFAGWNTAADGSGTSYAATGSATFTISANTTLYAKWTATVTWVVNGTTARTDANIVIPAAGKSVTPPTVSSLPCGDKFMGWTTTNIGAVGLDKTTDAAAITALNLFTGSKTVTGNTTFYAVFADYAE